MNVVKEIHRLNTLELSHSLSSTTASWHNDYRSSPYIFIGGLDSKLTEGDIIVVFSQFGEVVDLNLVRDKETGQSKGFGFLAFEDQRSTDLAVDNLNGIMLLNRTIRVDHVKDYRPPKSDSEGEGEGGMDNSNRKEKKKHRVAPRGILPSSDDESGSEDDEEDTSKSKRNKYFEMAAALDPEDPMVEYYMNKGREKEKKRMVKAEKKKAKKEKKKGKKDKEKEKERDTKSVERRYDDVYASRRRERSWSRSRDRYRGKSRSRSRDRSNRTRRDDGDYYNRERRRSFSRERGTSDRRDYPNDRYRDDRR